MVRVRDLGHDGQPKAGTPGLAGPWRIQADEAVEYPTSVGHGYAPTIIGDDRMERIAKGSGQKKEQVRGLLDRFFAMQKVMKQLGGGPGAPGMNLLQRLPGFRQLAQLNSLKGMAPEDLASMFGLPKDAGAGGIPAAGGKGSHSAALARQRLMGMGAQPSRVISDEEKKRMRERKKKERQNKKKNRKR